MPAVLDMIDVDSEKWRSYAQSANSAYDARRWLYALEARRLQRAECRLPAAVRAVTLVSPCEAQLYEHVREAHFGGTLPAKSAPAVGVYNGVDLDYFAPADDPTQPKCVFVGAMDYRPNVQAVEWFCEHVWPGVVRQLPQARFTIVGRNPTGGVQRLARLPGVAVTGEVPDVRPYVREAAVVVAPLLIARGIQNKVLEAMAMARPVLASPQALAGLAIIPRRHVELAEGPAEWIDQLVRLLPDHGRRAWLGQQARDFVESHHQWSTCLESLADMVLQPPRVPAQPGPAVAVDTTMDSAAWFSANRSL